MSQTYSNLAHCFCFGGDEY